MRVSYTDYNQHDSQTIFASNSAELNAAVRSLANGSGGTVEVDPNGGPYDLKVSNVGSASSPVLIKSAGNAMPLFESVELKNVEYITIDGINVDTSHMQARSRWEEDVEITGSSHVEFVNSSIIGGAEGYLSEATSHDVAGVTGISVDESQDITFSGNFVSNYMYAVKVNDTKGLNFSQNEITQWQADAFHGAGLQDAYLGDNWLHLPLGSTQSIAHSDFFQIRMVNTALDNRNIEIAGNIMDSEGGPAAQGIHMGTAGSNGLNTNISVHDNVIHSGLPRGIGIDGANGLEIYNNTLLWNESAFIEARPGADLNSWDPRILVTGDGIEVNDNVASWIRVNGSHQDSGGYQIQYKTPSAANHVDNHVTNLDGSGNPSSYDLTFLESSQLYGRMGAAMSSEGASITVANAQSEPEPPVVVEAPVEPVAEAPVAPETSEITVTFKLVNTQTDEVIAELAEGDVLDSAYLESTSVSIYAETSEPVGSVRLSLGDYSHVENGAPYALFGDWAGDFWDPEEAPFAAAGTYELKAELFESKGAVGKIGEAGVGFAVEAPEVVPVAPAALVVPPVAEEVDEPEAPGLVTDDDIHVTLSLIDTETDEILGSLAEGDVLDPSVIGSTNVSIVAELSEEVGSVALSIGDWTQIENQVPYALFGNRGDDYFDARNAPFTEAGDYEVKVEFFEFRQGVGKIGETTATISVGDDMVPMTDAPSVVTEDPIDDEVVYEDPTLEDLQELIVESFEDLENGEDPAAIFDQVLDFLTAIALSAEAESTAENSFESSALIDELRDLAIDDVEEPVDVIL